MIFETPTLIKYFSLLLMKSKESLIQSPRAKQSIQSSSFFFLLFRIGVQ